MIIGISGKKQHGKDTVADIIQRLTTPKPTVCEEDEFGRSLKDEKGNYVLKPTHSVFERKQFAGKLKQMVTLLIGCTLDQLEDNTFKETPLGKEWESWMVIDSPFSKLFSKNQDIQWLAKGERYFDRKLTPRMILQLLGTTCCRDTIHPDVWVNALMCDYKSTMQNSTTKEEYAKGRPLNYNRPTYPNWIITDVRFPNELEAIEEAGGVVVRVNRSSVVNTDKHPSENALDIHNFDYVLTNDGSIKDLEEGVQLLLNLLRI